MEAAHHVEIIDPDTHGTLADGETGNLFVTVLSKDDFFPVIRFNTNDLSAIEPSPSPLGLTLRRIKGFLGRSDNMVKLRGINVYPTAIGELLQDEPQTTGEFLCRVERIGGRDELTVVIEVSPNPAEHAGLIERYRDLLRRRLGVEVLVELVAPGALAPLTGLESRQKPIRLIDNRFSDVDPPLVKLVPKVTSAEERFKSLKALRPRFRLPNKISAIWWPRYVRSLGEHGVWDAIARRIVDNGYPAAAGDLDEIMRELLQKERLEIHRAIAGAGNPIVSVAYQAKSWHSPPGVMTLEHIAADGRPFDQTDEQTENQLNQHRSPIVGRRGARLPRPPSPLSV
jgi:hypothetical protein